MRLFAIWFILTVSFAAIAAELEVPATLAEAHLQLERELSKEELAKIDAMKSEDEMIIFHRGFGMGIRNRWGLWKGGPLANHLNELEFTHPDDMSSVILKTFWCKRQGKDFRLKERADYYTRYWKGVADPPETAKDPQDSSEIEWTSSIGYGDNKPPRQIHIGRNKKNGRILVYEYDKGVYVPEKAILDYIAEFKRQTE